MLRTVGLALIASVSFLTIAALRAADPPEEDSPKASRQKESPKPPADVDVTAKVRLYNSDKYAAPPVKFRAGHIKPRKLDPKALSKTETGFVVQLPSKAPVATPAVYKDKVYVSGGFQSKQFFCLDAKSGKLIWGFDLDDDGPSSAAVEDGVVVYNTESCTIFTHDAETGKLLWSYWLGDPLMSSPTIAGGRVFAAYPASGRTAASAAAGGGGFGGALQQQSIQNNDTPQTNAPAVQQQEPAAAPKKKPAKKGAKPAKPLKKAPPQSHVLACFELKTGKILWQRWIDSDVMSAPVAVGDMLHVASFGGTVYKFSQKDGRIHSAIKSRATSAPTVVGGEVLYTKRTDAGGKARAREGIVAIDGVSNQTKWTEQSRIAFNLDETVQRGSKLGQKSVQLDEANGFAGGAPAQANAKAASDNIGYGTVSSLQAFQGSRVLRYGGFNYGCPGGDELVCTYAHNGKAAWKLKLDGDLKKEGGFLAAPPAAAGGQIFLTTLKGEVLQLDPKGGKVGKRYKVGYNSRFQPAVVDGRIYVGTQCGKLVCIDTGNPKFTGWAMWGGNAARTGVVDKITKK